MGVRLGEAAVDGVVVAGAEVVLAGLGVVVLAAVAEGVTVIDIRDFLVAEGIIGVGIGGDTFGVVNLMPFMVSRKTRVRSASFRSRSDRDAVASIPAKQMRKRVHLFPPETGRRD